MLRRNGAGQETIESNALVRKQTAFDRGQTDRISLTHDLGIDL